MKKKIPEFLRILSNQYYRRNNFYCTGTYDTDVSTYIHILLQRFVGIFNITKGVKGNTTISSHLKKKYTYDIDVQLYHGTYEDEF